MKGKSSPSPKRPKRDRPPSSPCWATEQARGDEGWIVPLMSRVGVPPRFLNSTERRGGTLGHSRNGISDLESGSASPRQPIKPTPPGGGTVILGRRGGWVIDGGDELQIAMCELTRELRRLSNFWKCDYDRWDSDLVVLIIHVNGLRTVGSDMPIPLGPGTLQPCTPQETLIPVFSLVARVYICVSMYVQAETQYLALTLRYERRCI